MDKFSSTSVPSLGDRVRELRMRHNIKQADLADRLGISASYLNLIEHDRRRISDALMDRIADALEVDTAALTASVEQSLVDSLLMSAARFGGAAEVERAAEFAMRFPGWAGVIAQQFERIAWLENRVQELSDRMTYDPTLSVSLNEVISAATSIRSTASILNGDDPLDADWQRRFHKNLHNDAIRLAESSETLISYLEAPEEGDAITSPLQEAEAFLAERGFHLPELEQGSTTVSAMVKAAPLAPDAAEILRGYLTQRAADAKTLPMADFEGAAADCRYDPGQLSARLAQPLDLVLRRLAALPPGRNHPPTGFVQADASGVLGVSKHLPGVIIPRSGACPLWPVYTSLGQPGRPLAATVALPGQPELHLRCFALAQQSAASLGQAPVVKAIMLMMPDPASGNALAQKIGPTCRICPRSGCTARREPAAL